MKRPDKEDYFQFHRHISATDDECKTSYIIAVEKYIDHLERKFKWASSNAKDYKNKFNKALDRIEDLEKLNDNITDTIHNLIKKKENLESKVENLESRNKEQYNIIQDLKKPKPEWKSGDKFKSDYGIYKIITTYDAKYCIIDIEDLELVSSNYDTVEELAQQYNLTEKNRL